MDQIQLLHHVDLDDLNYRQQTTNRLRDYYYENRAVRFEKCGSTGFVYKCGCGKVTHGHFKCEMRICPECAEKNAFKLFKEFKGMIERLNLINSAGHNYRFRHIVLTCPVQDLFYDVNKVFTRIEYIRQYLYEKFHKNWGGIVGFEIGHKNLMCHFHLLLYCPFIPKPEIEKKWRLGYVWIGLANKKNDLNKALYNVCLYVTGFKHRKGGGKVHDPETLVNIELALKGKRRIKTWGMFYNRLKPKLTKLFLCPDCCGLMKLTGIKENGMIYSLETYNFFVSNFFSYLARATDP